MNYEEKLNIIDRLISDQETAVRFHKKIMDETIWSDEETRTINTETYEYASVLLEALTGYAELLKTAIRLKNIINGDAEKIRVGAIEIDKEVRSHEKIQI